MDNLDVKKLEYAIDMATLQLKEYKLLSFTAPILLMIVTAVIGVISDNWWQAALYVLVLAFNYPRWRKSIASIEDALHELRACLIENRMELSENAQRIYDSSVPSTSALWLGIIALGIVSGACIYNGAIIIKVAYYSVLDVPTLVIGLFLTGLGMVAAIPAIKWVLMLPRAGKLEEAERQ